MRLLCRRRLAVDGCAANLKLSRRHVTTSQITAFSHGYFRAEDIVDAEHQVCCALTWRLPTTLVLRGRGAVLEDAALRDRPWRELEDTAHYLHEILAIDGWFCDRRPSSFAVAALEGLRPHVCCSRVFWGLVRRGLRLPGLIPRGPRPLAASSPVHSPRLPWPSSGVALVCRGPCIPWDAKTIVLLEEKENKNSSK